MGKKNKSKIQKKKMAKSFKWDSLKDLRLNYNKMFSSVYTIINAITLSSAETNKITATGVNLLEGFKKSVDELYNKFCIVGTVHVDYELNENKQVNKEFYKTGIVNDKDLNKYAECYKLYNDIYITLLQLSEKSLLELIEIVDPSLEYKDNILELIEVIINQKSEFDQTTELLNGILEIMNKKE